MKKTFVIFLFGIFFIPELFSQVTIGAEQDPNENAVLELISSDKGFLLPRVELVNISDPTPLKDHIVGMVVYNTGTSITEGYYYNDGSKWVLVADQDSNPWRTGNGDVATSNFEDIFQMGSVGVGTNLIHESAQFEVASETKGVLIPRMSTERRNSLSTTAPVGLLIYNTTTNCFNYFIGGTQQWVSLCGSADPADYELADCGSRSDIEGSYQQSTPMDINNKYTVRIRVNVPGTYTILASTNNGYSFTKTGSFTERGTYTLELEGQGVPENPGTDNLTFYINGNLYTPSCTLPTITVTPSEVSYNIVCNNITLSGAEYVKNETPGNNTHYVDVGINVTNPGNVQIEAVSNISGETLRFSSGAIDITQTTTSIRLYAQGAPVNVGNQTFTIDGVSGCTFDIDVITLLGSFASPAKSCFEIYSEYTTGTPSDGEYYIQDQATGNAFKTLCDMTNGGYTLIWSYSEQTASAVYSPTGNIAIGGSSQIGWRYSQDWNRNVNTEINRVNYENYRIPTNTISQIQTSGLPSYIIRIAENADNATDAWGALNYIQIDLLNKNYDFVVGTSGSEYSQGAQMNINGFIFGRSFNRQGCTKSFNGSQITSSCSTDPSFYRRQTGFYPEHLNYSGASSNFTPLIPGGNGDAETRIPTSANLFGVFRYGDTLPNHHFGKCGDGGANASDTSFSTPTCSGQLYPHSINNVNGTNQGRYLQWFVK